MLLIKNKIKVITWIIFCLIVSFKQFVRLVGWIRFFAAQFNFLICILLKSNLYFIFLPIWKHFIKTEIVSRALFELGIHICVGGRVKTRFFIAGIVIKLQNRSMYIIFNEIRAQKSKYYRISLYFATKLNVAEQK